MKNGRFGGAVALLIRMNAPTPLILLLSPALSLTLSLTLSLLPSPPPPPCRHPALFEECAVQQLLDTQFSTYMDRVKSTDCQAELRRLLAAGPPVHVADKNALPVPKGDTHVSLLWYARDGEEREAVLKGAVVGEEREVLWEELRGFLSEEGDDEGEGKLAKGGEGKEGGEGKGGEVKE